MLWAADNQLLTRVEVDAPVGQMMQAYCWFPALRTAQPVCHGGPVRAKLLGDRYVAFRGGDMRVNTIRAGRVDTPMLRGAYSDPAAVARIVERRALKRLSHAGEFASAILLLTSDESSYVTGATLPAGDGRTFH